MELQKRITQLRTLIMKKIEDAAKIGNTALVVESSKIVEEIESIEKQLEQVLNSLSSIEKIVEQNGALDSVEFSTQLVSQEKGISPKKRGQQRRTAFVKRAQQFGIDVLQLKGVRYKVNNKNLIGIAYSGETRPNRWFFGLPHENFDTIVLLCERKNGQIMSFVFTKEFYKRIKIFMSTDNTGQFKYNITFRNEEYQLMIPERGCEKINLFLDNFDNLY